MGLQQIDIRNKNFTYVLAVAECGTITAAAEKLFISQPALSRYLKNLESRLGITLFDRIDNRLFLTSAGQQYISYAKQINEMEEQMEAALTQLRSENRKCIRLGIPAHWASFLIPPLMARLHEQLPQISLEVVEVNSKELDNLLLNYTVDLTISRQPNNQQAITSQLLHPDPILLAVPPETAKTLHTVGTSPEGLPILDNRELAHLQYILPQKGQSLRNKVDLIFQDLHILPNISILIRSIETSMRLVGQEYGCCFVSRMHKRAVDMHNPPVYFAIDHPQASLSLHVNYLAGRSLPPHIQQFVRYVAQSI